MKKLLLITVSILSLGTSYAQTKKDGTPDMRYKVNKELYGNNYSYSTQTYSTQTYSTPTYSTPTYSTPTYSTPTYSTPTYSTPTYSTPTYSAPTRTSNYSNGGNYKVQNGYYRSNGTYVAPHLKTSPDNVKYNNYNSYK